MLIISNKINTAFQFSSFDESDVVWFRLSKILLLLRVYFSLNLLNITSIKKFCITMLRKADLYWKNSMKEISQNEGCAAWSKKILISAYKVYAASSK